MPFNPKNWNELDEVYYSEVDKCALNASDFSIDNSNPKHAVYLINKLFVIAKKRVRIFSDHLISELKASDNMDIENDLAIYSNPKIIQNACDFLKQNGTCLEIVLEKNPAEFSDSATNNLIDKFNKLRDSNELKGTFTIKVIDPTIKAKTGIDDLFSNHFMVADDRAFRVEKSPKEECFKAYANFGDVDMAEKLSKYFDVILSKISTPYNYNTVN